MTLQKTNGTAMLYKNGKIKGNNLDECKYSTQSFGKGDKFSNQ
ncbi:hypothetical protein JCM30197_21060 [Schleiferia thermophila]|jgi:hypothetical protein|nr:hypothetical protein JCM30197_21060 [Schleiferia thermophila]